MVDHSNIDVKGWFSLRYQLKKNNALKTMSMEILCIKDIKQNLNNKVSCSMKIKDEMDYLLYVISSYS